MGTAPGHSRAEPQPPTRVFYSESKMEACHADVVLDDRTVRHDRNVVGRMRGYTRPALKVASRNARRPDALSKTTVQGGSHASQDRYPRRFGAVCSIGAGADSTESSYAEPAPAAAANPWIQT